MKKLKLDADSLRVTSFGTGGEGLVLGAITFPGGPVTATVGVTIALCESYAPCA